MIKLKNITKKYGKFLAIKDVSFEIQDGEIIGLLGPNGAGKSTIMNMITGFIEPTDGKIFINGLDIDKKSKKAKAQIGYMPEGVPLYTDLTPREFVTFMAELKKVNRKNRKDLVEKALKETGVDNVSNQLIRSLSRGYKQRVSMAGALVGNPSILILDEPTVGLDPKQITEIRQLIKELGKNHTVILSSHILSEVSQLCKRVIIINKGEIVAIDSPENLENMTTNTNSLIVTVEDKNDKIYEIKEKLDGIYEIKLIKENTDGTKQYSITSNGKEDFRKSIFECCSKDGIIILEMKKLENSLEDAFMKLISDENSNVENLEKGSENNNANDNEERV